MSWRKPSQIASPKRCRCGYEPFNVDSASLGRFSVRNLDERGEPGLTLDQRHDLTAVGTAEQIAFPVSGYRTILRLGRPLPDRQGLGNPSTHLSFRAPASICAFRVLMPQQLFFQHAASLQNTGERLPSVPIS